MSASLPARSAPPARGLRLRLATIAGDLAAVLSRLAGRGSGASIRGQVLTRIEPDAFAALLRGRQVLAVSGTNGKTTTTHLLAAALRAGLGEQADRLALLKANAAISVSGKAELQAWANKAGEPAAGLSLVVDDLAALKAKPRPRAAALAPAGFDDMERWS